MKKLSNLKALLGLALGLAPATIAQPSSLPTVAASSMKEQGNAQAQTAIMGLEKVDRHEVLILASHADNIWRNK